MLKDTLKLIHEAKESNATTLDLSNCHFAELPDELKELVSLEILNLYNTRTNNLSPLKGLINLKQLNCRYTNVCNLTPLKGLVNLQKLILSDTEICDISPLKDLQNLEELDIRKTSVNEMSPLQGLMNFQKFKLPHTYYERLKAERVAERVLQRIHEAKETGSKTLDLANCNLKNLPDALFELTELEELMLCSDLHYWDFEKNEKVYFKSQNEGERNAIEYISPEISRLKKLKVLLCHKAHTQSREEGVYTCNSCYATISDLTSLKNLANLEQLSIGLKDMNVWENPLEDLTNLRYLNLTNCRDLSAIINVVNLQYLDIGETSVENLSVLENLVHLRELNISDTNVQNLNPLKELVNLHKLNICYTKVSDLSPLKNLINLRILNIYNSQVNDIRPLKDLVHLYELDISNTQVTDIRPLISLVHWQRIFEQRKKRS